EILGINVIFDDSRDYHLKNKKGARVVELIHKVGATEYLSGPAAKNYLDANEFIASGIKLEWMNYDHYPEYPQLFPPFCHYVTILDLLFNVGCDFKHYMMLNNK
ncbi:WbqC family protein, partial [Aeromonas salmonicida]